MVHFVFIFSLMSRRLALTGRLELVAPVWIKAVV